MSHVLAVLGQAAPAQQGGLLGMLALMLIVFAIFYFLMIRPQQQQQQKKHKSMIENLKKGDEVITRSGIIGTIYGIADNIITLEVENNVRFKMIKDQVAGLRGNPLAQTK
ncbi:MAG: preprotein translocase subunit YajC [Deltaproteobacteria bacterium CG11_big_fil_rev_8_21_14_0_20_47_16]|nr:MAG: preprotein translocase subunit YajC [Deltaproteobacteria bacterium CG11_big_fil_rev_8_21_14_0_20_47_16]